MSITPPPFKDSMFIKDNVLERTWVRFFHEMFSNLESLVYLETVNTAQSTLGEQSTQEENDLSLAFSPSSSTVSTRPESSSEDDTLALYWMGV